MSKFMNKKLCFFFLVWIDKLQRDILPPSQNISKKWSTKVNVFGAKLSPDTLTFVDPFLFILWNGSM
jgi:hypothetical protein